MPHDPQMLTSKQVERIRRSYPPGTRIQLASMDDSQGVPPGTCGTVVYVDDAGQIGMKWDNGRSLSLVPGVDSFATMDPTPPQRTAPGQENAR